MRRMAPPDLMSSGQDRARTGPLALVMSGGGARAAYQAGLLRGLSRLRPELPIPILTGVSAGAINASFLAAAEGSLQGRAEQLTQLWLGIEIEDVMDTEGVGLAKAVSGFGLRLLSGGRFQGRRRSGGFVQTEPLRRLLERQLHVDANGQIPGIARNLERGALEAVAITGSSYEDGSSVTWIEGRTLTRWERPKRRSVSTRMRADHILASSSLPLLFPPILVDGRWYGDGGIRLTSPLAPAIHLGAERILAVSTRFGGRLEPRVRTSFEPASPTAAQIGGTLLNAIFLDLLDQDARHLTRINRLIEHVPPIERGRLKHIALAVVRPSQDLGRLANAYEARMPKALRFLTRGWGTRETPSNDLLSLIMFQRDYLERLVALGEHDAQRLESRLLPFLDREPVPMESVSG
jgi:NTE family protein